MNKLNKNGLFSLLLVTLLFSCQTEQPQSNNQYVNKFIGTGLNGCVTPVASVPFGMVQIGADTHANSSGYHYDHTSLVGFSHVHKSGGGCGDFLDILFLPLPLNYKTDSFTELYSQYYQADFFP